jgi:hypothetical protein
MELIKLKNPNQSVEVQTQEHASMPLSSIKRILAIGAITIVVAGFALVMIKMGKIMAKDLGDMGV